MLCPFFSVYIHDYKVSLDGIPVFCMLIRFPPPNFRYLDKKIKKVFKKVFVLKFSLIFEQKKKESLKKVFELKFAQNFKKVLY